MNPSNYPISMLYARALMNQKQYNEFIQEAGDLVYIPRYWSHGVINLKESIGVATEFTSPYIF